MSHLKHLGLKHPEIISAAGLDAVESEVGTLKQILRFNAVFWGQRDSNAGSEASLMAIEINRLGKGTYNP
jgi:hypothetical protein